MFLCFEKLHKLVFLSLEVKLNGKNLKNLELISFTAIFKNEVSVARCSTFIFIAYFRSRKNTSSSYSNYR